MKTLIKKIRYCNSCLGDEGCFGIDVLAMVYHGLNGTNCSPWDLQTNPDHPMFRSASGGAFQPCRHLLSGLLECWVYMDVPKPKRISMHFSLGLDHPWFSDPSNERIASETNEHLWCDQGKISLMPRSLCPQHRHRYVQESQNLYGEAMKLGVQGEFHLAADPVHFLNSYLEQRRAELSFLYSPPQMSLELDDSKSEDNVQPSSEDLL